MRCDRCGDEFPPDARFCIGCGATLAATGATVRLATDTALPHQPAPAFNAGGANRATANDPGWLGDLLIVVFELLACL
jgi:hypothetical protein